MFNLGWNRLLTIKLYRQQISEYLLLESRGQIAAWYFQSAKVGLVKEVICTQI